ncbi:unnamed protein product [Ranitomeya imitator]|uniref:Reverse transcriptase domain-containing protein n=1 Tax=Ranitomeya imitator TaxID=111125 RepID=A0ABN9MEU6_9NEOB|nr:unnamed protein product [Ranitomeya imitator]
MQPRGHFGSSACREKKVGDPRSTQAPSLHDASLYCRNTAIDSCHPAAIGRAPPVSAADRYDVLSRSETDRRDNPGGSNSFLGQRRRRQPQRRRGPGGANERRDADFYRVTRSQKGLFFCPSYKFDTFNMDMDIHCFYRRLRLLVHFDSSETSPVTTSDTSRSLISSHSLGLRNKSTYRPPRSSHAVEAFIGFIEQSFSKLCQDIEAHKLHTSTNLSAPDFQALQTLRNDKNIIIKPADKGGAIVVMNKSDYTKEIHRQLHDDTVYRPLPADPTTMIRNLIKETLDPYVEKCVIDDKTREYLTKDFPITPVFYILPKIHKSLEHPPGRPIVASTESILSPLAIFLEKILTPLIRTLPSFLLDTGDFLHQLRNLDSLPTDLLLVSLDVKDLYTSIPHTQGILSVRHLLTNSLLHPEIINLCIDLLTIVLTKKFFMFEDQFFLQTKGTAMGYNVAPPYANSYMALFEEEIVYPDPLFQTYCPFWRRYIDDVFCLWTGTPQTLDLFFHTLNTAWPGLTFTMTSNTEKVSFLDTLVFRDELGTLKTDLYTKPTDRNSLLHFHSLHPTATKRSIPRSQFKRVQRIVTDPNLLKTRTDEMYLKFRERGYPPDLLTEAINPHTTVRPPSNKRVPFVYVYHPYVHILHHSIRRHWNLLRTAHPQIPEFQEHFLPCYKRPSNIRDSLVKADLGTNKDKTQRFLNQPRHGTFPCLHCNQCNSVIKGDVFHHPHSGKRYNIKGYFTCDSSFVIYAIKCPCGLVYIGSPAPPLFRPVSIGMEHSTSGGYRVDVLLLPITYRLPLLLSYTLNFGQDYFISWDYVGKTKRELRVHISEHLGDIRHGRDTPVARHINTEHGGAQRLLVPLMRVRGFIGHFYVVIVSRFIL